jgi:transcriptional regulator with XRE-family HTH domain
MSGRPGDRMEIPDSLWQRAGMTEALRTRDIGRVFRLVSQYAGVSQTRLAIACCMTQPKISGIMRGAARVEALEVFERIADGLGMPDAARLALGIAPRTPGDGAEHGVISEHGHPGRDIPSRDTAPGLADHAISGLLGTGPASDEEDEDIVRRRTFVGLASASLFGAVSADTPGGGQAGGLESLVAALAGHSPDATVGAANTAPDLPSLAVDVAQVKRRYQACRYASVVSELPGLISRLQAACAVLDGPARLRASTLSAEAHHVAARIALKTGDPGLGWLAADRSMQAARASQDPVTVGSSARIVASAMMSSGHLAAAAATASAGAQRLDREVGAHDPESLSVYGSLLLSGAVAAARDSDRHTADELLSEAEEAGKRLGEDRNIRWTAFGPTNAKLHRVNTCVVLGDAGTALDVARTVDLTAITVTERKATFLIDAARAFLQCGRHEQAYLALRAAERIAPEEITARREVHRVVLDLIATSPPSVLRPAEDFGRHIGLIR